MLCLRSTSWITLSKNAKALLDKPDKPAVAPKAIRIPSKDDLNNDDLNITSDAMAPAQPDFAADGRRDAYRDCQRGVV